MLERKQRDFSFGGLEASNGRYWRGNEVTTSRLLDDYH